MPTIAAGYDEDKTLNALIAHLRNAVCHASFEFIGGDTNGTREITGINFWDRKTHNHPIHWKASISISDLEGFVTRRVCNPLC
jgi:HEPN family protein